MFGHQVHIPSKYIKRPKGPDSTIRSLARSMGLGDHDSPKFHAFIASARRVAKNYLVPDCDFDEQDPTKRQEALGKICSELPWITQYQGSWPFDVYLRRYLKQKRANHQKRRPRSPDSDDEYRDEGESGSSNSETERESSPQSDDIVEVSPPHTAARESHNSTPAYEAAVPTRVLRTHGRASRNSTGVSHKSPSLPCHTSKSSTSAPKNRPVTLRRFEGTHDASSSNGFNEVVNFLRPLELEELAEDFIRAGATNGKHIRMLAKASDPVKDEFLKRDLKLNKLERRVVRSALDNLFHEA